MTAGMMITQRYLLTYLLTTCVCVVSLTAQDVPAVTRTDTEIGAFAGASVGIDKTRFMGGGNIARAVGHRSFMPYAEFSYFPGIGRRETLSTGTIREFSIPLYDFHGGIHLRVPVHERYFVPYGVFGAGVIHSPARSVTATVPGNPPQVFPNLEVASRTDFAVNGGGGIRFYVAEKVGFRVEAKIYKPTGQFTNPFGKVVGGVFYQFK